MENNTADSQSAEFAEKACRMHADFAQCLRIILENPDNIIKTADRLFGEHLLMQAEESDKIAAAKRGDA